MKVRWGSDNVDDLPCYEWTIRLAMTPTRTFWITWRQWVVPDSVLHRLFERLS